MINIKEVFFICIFVNIVFGVFGTTLEDANTPGVILKEDNVIEMDEELPLDVIVANIVCEDDSVPVVEFLENSINNKEFFEVVKNNGVNKYSLIIKQKLDYENMNGLPYDLLFDVKCKTEINCNLRIMNINDNAPIIVGSTCVIEENSLESNCLYEVSDADGIPSEGFTYTIDPSNLESTFKFTLTSKEANKHIYTLYPINKLDFETTSLYSFKWIVNDGLNKQSINVIVEVDDIPDEDPQWTKYFGFIQIDEENKYENEFCTTAIDGDVGLNHEINYLLEDNELPILINIDKVSGCLIISEIDRESVEKTTFKMNCIAYDVEDNTSRAVQEVTIFLNDINDNVPIITLTNPSITIDEHFNGKLAIEIIIEDKDIGENAMYSVELKNIGSEENYISAFQVVPTEGYLKSTFSITVNDNEKLDYENPKWRNIEFQLFAQDKGNNAFIDKKDIKITLININDNSPVFSEELYSVDIPEDFEINKLVITVFAEDADEGDKITYSLMNLKSSFNINPTTGEITTRINNAFDYEKQTEVLLTVQAKDCYPCDDPNSKVHTTVAQVQINVIDVNDEKPTIKISTEEVTVNEHLLNAAKEEKQFLKKGIVTATDVDTTANLKFEINWDNTQFRKNGQEKSVDCKINKCLSAATTSEMIDNVKTWILELNVENTVELDYEQFDTINLNIIVTDEGQTIMPNFDDGILQIKINDMNDNAPIIKDGQKFSVEENSKTSYILGTIDASDVDTVGQLTFTLTELNETPKNLVVIDDKGDLKVNANIDADIPLFSLTYEVCVFDEVHKVCKDISIEVLDLNDNKPILDDLVPNKIFEHSEPGTIILEIKATDKDRDVTNNKLTYKLLANNDEVLEIIKLDQNKIVVVDKSKLDRESELFPSTITVNVRDNSEDNAVEKQFELTLEDINDQKPTIQDTKITISEDAEKGEIGTITIIDKDKENDYKKVILELISVSGGEGEDASEILNVSEKGQNGDNFLYSVIAKENLRGYYGQYTLNLKASNPDGNEAMIDTKSIILNIEKYNFEAPVFTFPKDNDILYLRTKQTINSPLYKYNDELLENFIVDNNQGNKWSLTMAIENSDLFTISQRNNKEGSLQLIKNLPTNPQPVELRLTVKDNGTPDSKSNTITIHINYFDSTTEPVFSKNDEIINWVENNDALSKQLPTASFQDAPENIEIYYFLTQITPNGEGTNEIFSLDSKTNTLSLNKALDREEIANYEIVVIASRKQDGNVNPSKESTLTIQLKVDDVNDEEPVFDSTEFSSGIVFEQSSNGDMVLTVTATDKDEDPKLTYNIIKIAPNGEGISSINNPFIIDEERGDIKLNFELKSDMKGYFLLDLTVYDGVHTGTSTAKIYIVSKANIVEFQFENEMTALEAKTDKVTDILTEQFNYKCYKQSITKNTDSSGQTIENESKFKAYFINEQNEAVDKDVIYNKLYEASTFAALKQKLLEESLLLKSVGTSTESNVDDSSEIQIWLICVSVICGVLTVILAIALFMRNRILTQRIAKLSNTQFGSIESITNRKPLPNSNMHMNEGSNPIYNIEKEHTNYDTRSNGSGDSELDAVEDNPQFDYHPNDRRASFNPVMFNDDLKSPF